MFIIDEVRSAYWPVEVPVAADGGKVETATFEMRFVALDIDQLTALKRKEDELTAQTLEEIEGDADGAVVRQASLGDRMAEIVMGMAIGWRGLGLSNSEGEAQFTAANVRKLVIKPGVFGAISNAYRKYLAGIPSVREGN